METTLNMNTKMYLFGEIINGKMVSNNMGHVVDHAIQETPKIRNNVQIDIYQIMPNHVHIIVVITNRRGVSHTPHIEGEFNSPLQFKSPSQTLGSIIRGLKSTTTKQIRIIMGNPQFSVWQRNYFEHIIRNEKDLNKISQYIIDNPLMWGRDRNNVENIYV